MYVVDGIAYAGEQQSAITVVGVRPLDDFKLWLRFSTGEIKVFDCTELIKNSAAFAPLSDEVAFKSVYIDYGIPCWNNGDIDIAPEYLYEHSVSVAAA